MVMMAKSVKVARGNLIRTQSSCSSGYVITGDDSPPPFQCAALETGRRREQATVKSGNAAHTLSGIQGSVSINPNIQRWNGGSTG